MILKHEVVWITTQIRTRVYVDFESPEENVQAKLASRAEIID